jgi:hypothetical protein
MTAENKHMTWSTLLGSNVSSSQSITEEERAIIEQKYEGE